MGREASSSNDVREKRGAMLRNNSYRAEDRWDDDDYESDDRGGRRGFGFGGGGPLWRKLLLGAGILIVVGFLAVVGFIIAALQGLPSLSDLQDYQPPVSSRVHAGDGALVAEFAEEQRVFVPIEQIPDHVK